MEIFRGWKNLCKKSLCPEFGEVFLVLYCIFLYSLVLSDASFMSSLFAEYLKSGRSVFLVYPLAVRRRNNFIVISS